eukprot:scaffold2753_cov115-Isochrysis_galbana.AAC.7
MAPPTLDVGCAEVLWGWGVGVSLNGRLFILGFPRACCACDLVRVCGGRRGGASGPCGARWPMGSWDPGVGPPLPLSGGACLGVGTGVRVERGEDGRDSDGHAPCAAPRALWRGATVRSAHVVHTWGDVARSGDTGEARPARAIREPCRQGVLSGEQRDDE